MVFMQMLQQSVCVCLCSVHIITMGLLLGKAMDENFKKNQEFMLASQRAQVCSNTDLLMLLSVNAVGCCLSAYAGLVCLWLV